MRRTAEKSSSRVRPKTLAPLARQYEEIGKAYRNLAERYDDGELQLICDDMESASKVSRRELANLPAVNGLRSPQVKPTPSPAGRDGDHRSSTSQK
jgi:hypothetical protein